MRRRGSGAMLFVVVIHVIHVIDKISSQIRTPMDRASLNSWHMPVPISMRSSLNLPRPSLRAAARALNSNRSFSMPARFRGCLKWLRVRIQRVKNRPWMVGCEPATGLHIHNCCSCFTAFSFDKRSAPSAVIIRHSQRASRL